MIDPDSMTDAPVDEGDRRAAFLTFAALMSLAFLLGFVAGFTIGWLA